ncbi:MAG TPA: amidohydrolase family protein [Candidatus Methylomirabilis sp.]|nr:amidohydrolase family protein [Candidatus Methylomirabilis sp.]
MALAALPPLISSDGHLEVVPERWTGRMPAKLRDKAPRTIKLADGGDAILVEGQKPYPVPFLDLRAGRTNETWQPFGVTVADTAGVGPPEQRLREQDMDGLHAEVLFPNMQLGPRLWRTMADEDAYRAAVRAYNEWLGEEYCPVSRDRLIGLGVIPWTTLDDAIAELEHCAQLGLKGVALGVFPSGKSYATPEDDRFWAAALEMRMPLTVHVGFDRLGPRASEPTFIYRDADPAMVAKVSGRNLVEWMAFLGLPPALSFTQMIMSGVFDRLPDLQMFFAETRLGWVPFWMEEADYWYERHRHWAERLLNVKPLRQRPSDYVRQHIHFSVQHVERVAVELRHHLGVDHVMFSTDFPHIECDWPNTRPFAERLFAGVPRDEAFKIAAGNMLRYFRLEDTPMGRTVLAAKA